MTQLMTVREVAQMLQLTERSVRERVARGTIPFKRLDGAIRFDPDEIRAWINSKSAGLTDETQKTGQSDSPRGNPEDAKGNLVP